MVAPVVRLLLWVKVVPVLVVHRYLPLLRISVIQVVVTFLLRLEVVWIINVRIVVESLPVGWLPRRSCFCRRGSPDCDSHQGGRKKTGGHNSPDHRNTPCKSKHGIDFSLLPNAVALQRIERTRKCDVAGSLPDRSRGLNPSSHLIPLTDVDMDTLKVFRLQECRATGIFRRFDAIATTSVFNEPQSPLSP